MMNRHLLLPAVLMVFTFGAGHSVSQHSVATAGPARGVVAVSSSGGAVVSWRLLDSDPADVAFHVYRRDVYADSGYEKISRTPVQVGTSYLDSEARPGFSYRYRIHALIDGDEVPSKDEAYLTATGVDQPYISIALGGSYTARSLGVGDLNGDGVLDYVIKQPDFNTDPYHRPGYWKRSPEPYKLEAYSGSNGGLLWRYDMGWAIETGTWYSPYVVYDLDGDGKAEVYTKSGEGDPREIDGRVVEGPEYLIKIDGETGEVVARRDWHSREGWNHYNRSMRNMLAIAYLDGVRPSLIMQRGTYDLMKTAALDRHFNIIWNREAENPHELVGPGTHGLITADIDLDGKDELVLGATALDDDGSVLWATGLGHPDPCFVADIDPNRPGLEVFFGIEPSRSEGGISLADAQTGEIIWQYEGPTRHIHSKGLVGDIDPDYPGMEVYAGEQDGSQYWLYTADGRRLPDPVFGTLSPFAVWWDDDLQKELVVGGNLVKYPDDRIMEIEGRVLMIGDLLGDWREEIVTSLPGELRIYMSARPSERRRVWLMEDRQYRLGVVVASMGYFREPQLSETLAFD